MTLGSPPPSPGKQRDVPAPGTAQGAEQQLTAGVQGTAPGGECGGERVILTSTGISSSDMALAGLSLAEGAAATLLAKPCELGLGTRSLTGTDTGMTIGVRLSASGGSCGGSGGGSGWGCGGGAFSPSSYIDNKGFDPGRRAALTGGIAPLFLTGSRTSCRGPRTTAGRLPSCKRVPRPVGSGQGHAFCCLRLKSLDHVSLLY